MNLSLSINIYTANMSSQKPRKGSRTKKKNTMTTYWMDCTSVPHKHIFFNLWKFQYGVYAYSSQELICKLVQVLTSVWHWIMHIRLVHPKQQPDKWITRLMSLQYEWVIKIERAVLYQISAQLTCMQTAGAHIHAALKNSVHAAAKCSGQGVIKTLKTALFLSDWSVHMIHVWCDSQILFNCFACQFRLNMHHAHGGII